MIAKRVRSTKIAGQLICVVSFETLSWKVFKFFLMFIGFRIVIDRLRVYTQTFFYGSSQKAVIFFNVKKKLLFYYNNFHNFNLFWSFEVSFSLENLVYFVDKNAYRSKNILFVFWFTSISKNCVIKEVSVYMFIQNFPLIVTTGRLPQYFVNSKTQKLLYFSKLFISGKTIIHFE